MEKCLVTKHSGVTSDDSLLKVGEFRINLTKVNNPTSITQGFAIGAINNVKLNIIGDAYFTDKNLQQNLGKTLTINGDNRVKSFYVSNNNCSISVAGKYGITIFKLYPDDVVYNNSNLQNKELNIISFKYSSKLQEIIGKSSNFIGDMSDLADLTNMSNLQLTYANITGDISALSNMTKLYAITLTGPKISGDISSLSKLVNLTNFDFTGMNLTGDISALSNMTKLTDIYCYNTRGLYGNVSSLANLTKLISFRLSNLTGNISNLRNLQNLCIFTVQNGSLTGDISSLPDSCYYVNLEGGNNNFTWSNRPSTAKILTILGNPVISNIDKMLQDLSSCSAPSNVDSKIISASGTRTSASDDAVATLQSKGYTVSISKA